VKLVVRDNAADAAAAAGLLRDIAALRPQVASLATESASGSIRSAAARSAAVALVAEVYAARALNAFPATADPAFRGMLTATLDRNSERAATSTNIERHEADSSAQPPLSCTLSWALRECLRRDAEVREGLAALNAGA
jgi:hypothetical protein